MIAVTAVIAEIGKTKAKANLLTRINANQKD